MPMTPMPTTEGRPTATFAGTLLRGLRRRCPACGTGRIFDGYLKLAERCPDCGLETGEFRADDAPPYFTILLVGHLIVPSMLATEQTWHPPEWVHFSLWPPLALLFTLLLLPRIKGAVVGAMWSFRIRG
jgi:uncharacterized protein (DUF983 family)